MVDVGSKDATKALVVSYIPKSAYVLVTGSSDTGCTDKVIQEARTKGDVITVAQLVTIIKVASHTAYSVLLRWKR